MSESDPGCVKTCTSRECAELFSFFSSFDGDCQSGSFLIQRNRDKLSTRKFGVGVFTQPGPIPEISPEEWCVWSCPIPAIHPAPDIRRSSGGSDASRVNKAVRGDVVDLAARSTDIH